MSQAPVEVQFQTILDLTHAQRDRALAADVMAHAADIAGRDQQIHELAEQLEAVTARRDELAALVEMQDARITELEAASARPRRRAAPTPATD